ncbi:MAG: D-alanine--D-alanine ligase [bacterium]
MSRIKVAVLRGGPSSEYEVSLKTGKSVLDNLPEHYEAFDIFIDKEGVWHYSGKPVSHSQVFKMVDIVFNALHGAYGEDGTVQKILDQFDMPYTGSGSLASAIGMNKALTKNIYDSFKIKTPIYTLVGKDNNISLEAARLFKTFPMPAVVKPHNSGSSVGISIAKTLPELENAIYKALDYSDTVIIEEFIAGKEATCGVVENFRNEEIYSLLPVEIRKPDASLFFDYEAKYSGQSQEICPGNFTAEEKKIIQEMAAEAHKALGLSHYSRSDFIVNPRRGIYILETNTLPGLTSESLLPKSLQAIGCSFPQFLDHLIKLALQKNK